MGIEILVFVVVYLLSVYVCNILDNAVGIEEVDIINYIPFVNTFILLFCFIVAVMWYVVDLIMYRKN